MNHTLNTRQTQQRAGATGRAAYLLGMGPMPRPTEQDYAVAMMNNALDGGPLQEEDNSNNEDVYIDPHFRTVPQPQIVAVPAPVEFVTVRLPINNNVIRDIDFPADIPREDFFDRVFANMALDRATADLGWKSNDEPKHGRAHRLATNDSDDIDRAFRTLINTKNQPRRRREVFMEIIHLNPAPIEARKNKSNDNLATGSQAAYSAELRLVREKLRCGLHAGPNRWCYVTPEKPDEHVALGYEEISLWARSIHENDADPDCLLPPHCLRLPDLCQRAGRVRKNIPSIPPIHLHINNVPISGKANRNSDISQTAGPSTRNLKRSLSAVLTEESSGSDSDEEALLLSDVINRLHRKFPLLDLPQYIPLLKQAGIVYADTVTEFDRDFYIDLGMTEGGVGRFLSGVKRILEFKKREQKRARIYNKENSVEL
ncbi:hypothetical protein HYPSUDRAFT_201616 [Hypholoma sublateritium FD-334 SS-4]|uniref:SAM domain-containing protein n=1 Tax=Hypholoma sublateritium (strain FD-334 SS-4) TaxID=945553 RepID=A0A0D2NW77_HYPSF|nr:hypothetical protein HYPSUDRAFT_201616 [Hypholoma sublateritium FD-334 SS-4]